MRKQQILFFSFEKSLVVRGYGNIMLTLIIIIKSIGMRRYRIKHVWRIAQGGLNPSPHFSRRRRRAPQLNQRERKHMHVILFIHEYKITYKYSGCNRKN